ncbi:hypothetical protein ACJX0J_007251 [Zea mays]
MKVPFSYDGDNKELFGHELIAGTCEAARVTILNCTTQISMHSVIHKIVFIIAKLIFNGVMTPPHVLVFQNLQSLNCLAESKAHKEQQKAKMISLDNFVPIATLLHAKMEKWDKIPLGRRWTGWPRRR